MALRMRSTHHMLALLIRNSQIRSFSTKYLSTMSKTNVYLDITIGGKEAGRITMELRGDVVPKTAGLFKHRVFVVKV